MSDGWKWDGKNGYVDKGKTTSKNIPEIVQKWELGLISGDEAMNQVVKLLESK